MSNKKRIKLTGVYAVIMIALRVMILASTSANGLLGATFFEDNFDALDSNVWSVTFHRQPNTPPWDPAYGTAQVSNGVLLMRPTDVRGGAWLINNQISVSSLPATLNFRIRFQGDGYRAAWLKLTPLMSWEFGTTHHLFDFSQHRISLYDGAITDVGMTVIPHDTWLEGKIELHPDRVETSFDGINTVTYSDVASLLNSTTLNLQFGTFDDYTAQAFDLDWVTLSPNASTVVQISGPTAGIVNKDYGFTATTSPITASTPITYTWQASEQSPVVTHTTGLSNSTSFAWNTPGTKIITVTATNLANWVSGTHEFMFCPGDVNRDELINVIDIQLVAGRYGATCADNLYNVDYDLNNDCEIDIVDLQRVAVWYGTNCKGE